MPTAAFDRDSMARDYAKRHAESDPAILEIHYLPTNAPPDEIRLIEINEAITSMADPEPIDFGVDSGTPNGHKLIVFDVTPDQWQKIRKKTLSLPEGWKLEGSLKIGGQRRRRG
ncbi:MAG TPA: hypothetical protein VH575_26365 [Gemmataceae bacterium]